jgi:hypothetical protein
MNFKNELGSWKTLTIIMSFAVIITGTFIFQGCQKDDIIPNDELPYLSLGPGIDLSKISEKDMNILMEAHKRLDVYKKDGFYHIKQTSGAQVNISEDLFYFIKSLYNHTNDTFKSHNLSYSVPRLKSGDPEDGGGSSSSDCMAHALSYAGGGTYGSVGSYLISQYGGLSVPLSSFYDACHHFFPSGNTVSISSFSSGSMNNAIIIFMTGQGTAHAVNGLTYDQANGTIWYRDNNGYGTLWVNEIINIYRP